MCADDIRCPPHQCRPTVRRKNNSRRHWRFKEDVEISKAFNVKHVYLYAKVEKSSKIDPFSFSDGDFIPHR